MYFLSSAQKSSGEVYAAVIFNSCRNNGGTTACGTQVRTEQELGSVSSGVDASLTADDTNDTIDLDVTGASGESWVFGARIKYIRQ